MDTIDVWLGRFPSRSALKDYFSEKNDSEDSPINCFAADQGEKFYDHDWLEYHFSEEPDSNFLTYGYYPFGILAIAIQRTAVEQGLTNPNTLIVADRSLITTPKTVKGERYELRYLGEFGKHTDLAKYFDPAQTPVVENPEEWRVFPEDDESVAELKELANRGNFNAIAKLHLMYAAGIGVDRDRGKAYEWITLCQIRPQVPHNCFLTNAESGLAQAWQSLFLLHSGKGNSEASDQDCFQYVQRAAELGVIESQFELGLVYRDGKFGQSVDTNKAEKWLLSAVNADNSYMHTVYMFYSSRGEPGDEEQAFHWLSMQVQHTGGSAVTGYLARSYKAGNGVKVDRVMQLKYLYLSLCQHEELPERSLSYLARETDGCTPEQFEQGRLLAKEWIASHGKTAVEFGGEKVDPFEVYLA